MKKIYKNYLLLVIATLFASTVFTQVCPNITGAEDIPLECGEGLFITSQAVGNLMQGDCIMIDQTDLVEVVVEILVEQPSCDGDPNSPNTFPDCIIFDAGGTEFGAELVPVTQSGGSNVPEAIYRATIPAGIPMICLDDVTCSAISFSAYETRQGGPGAGGQVAFVGQEVAAHDDCLEQDFTIPETFDPKDYSVLIPILESSAGLSLDITVATCDANGVELTTQTETSVTPTGSNGAYNYETTLVDLPGEVTQIKIEVCSTLGNEESIGIGGVVATSPDGCDVPGSVSGTVLQDTNNDGMGDTPIVGVSLDLVDDMGNVIATVLTDSMGNYLFPDVDPGNYTVVQSQPPGFADVSEVDGGDDADNPPDAIINSIPVTVNSGEDDTGNDFVEVELASLSGDVTLDTNNDGMGDTPIAGVTINLLDGMGNPVLDAAGMPITTVTDSMGFYEFTDLLPGDYIVEEVQPTAAIAGTTNNPVSVFDEDEDDSDPLDMETNDGSNTNDLIPVSLSPGEDDIENNFVEVELGSISGNVSEDTTGDGMGDMPISGVILELLDDMGNPVLDAAGMPVTAVTDANGDFLFPDVIPGDYTVVEQQPAGLVDVSEAEGGADGDHPDDGVLNSIAVTVDPGEEDAGNDFVEAQPASLSGNVSEDTTGDGLGDTPIPGVIINLVDATGAPIIDPATGVGYTTMTDANGDYEFPILPPGDYFVQEIQPPGLVSVFDEDEDDSDSDDMETNNASNLDDLIPVSLVPGEDDVMNNFVEAQPASLSGNVSLDTTGDGLGDTPIAGVTIMLLDGMGNPVLDAAGMPITAVTDAMGNYIFPDLPPGDYIVMEVQPTAAIAGTTANPISVFDEDEDDSDPNDMETNDGDMLNDKIPSTLLPGEDDVMNNFVEVEPASLSGNVSEDTNNDGTGDTPISGVVINLVDAAGMPIIDPATGMGYTTTTDGMGNYEFPILPPGDYFVQEIQPTGLVSVYDEDEDDSDPDDAETNNGSNTDDLIPVSLLPGEDDVMNNFVEKDIIFPIELSSFTAEARGSDAELIWVTTTELNNSHFEIERSVNGIDYEMIAIIESKAIDGNSDNELSYEFIDKEAASISDFFFYRIKQVDLGVDPLFAFTPVREVSFENVSLQSLVFPNPTFRGSNITIQSNKAIDSIRMFNDSGLEVLVVDEDGLSRTTSISTSNLATGFYVIVINNEQTLKVVIN